MNRPPLAAASLLAVIAGLAISACGGSSSPSSSQGTSSSSSSSSSSSITNAGGSFCSQAGSDQTQLAHLTTGLTVSPGATPSVDSFKQLIGSVAQAIDSLDSSAPSEIASDFHTVRTAFDQANSQVQSATTLQQVGADFSALSTQAVKTAESNVSTYFKNTCHLGTPGP